MPIRILLSTVLLCALALTSSTNDLKTNIRNSVVSDIANTTKAVSDIEELMRHSRLGSFVYFVGTALFTDRCTLESFAVASSVGDFWGDQVYIQADSTYLEQVEEARIWRYIETKGSDVHNAEEEGLAQTIIPIRFSTMSKEQAGCK